METEKWEVENEKQAKERKGEGKRHWLSKSVGFIEAETGRTEI